MSPARRNLSRLGVGTAFVALLAGCSLLVSFEEPPATPELVDAGGGSVRDARPKPPTDEDDATVVVPPTPTPCDPDFPVSTLLFDGTLAADSGKLAPAAGFPAASWAYEGGSYRQTRLADAADATLFTFPASPSEDVDVETTAASTEISNAITPILRQVFILVGVTASADAFSAYGCGIEIVEGQDPTVRTSVVKLTGNAGAVVTTPIQRNVRQSVAVNELFKLRAHVKAGTLTCTFTKGADTVTTATATGRTDLAGSVGFFTRQTRGSFQRARVCRAGP